MKSLYLILGVSLLFSCQTKKQNSDSSHSSSVPDTVSSNQAISLKEPPPDKKTMDINTRSVVFFTVSQDEYTYLENSNEEGIEEVLSDFNYYTEIAYHYCTSNNIPVTYSSAGNFRVMYNNHIISNFNRYEESNGFGMIVFDGKSKLKIINGIQVDYIQDIREIIK